MKKRIKNLMTLFSICALFCVLGCSENFLEENPTGFVDPAALVVDKQGAEKYVVGAYNTVRVIAPSFTGWASAWGTFATDEIVMPAWGGDTKEIYLHTLSPSNATIRSIWEDFYVSINQVNSVVDRVSAMTVDQIDIESRDKLVGEARYLRAMLYFSLVSSFENIQLIKNETTSIQNLEVSQDPTKDVYDFIVADLLFSDNVLDAVQGSGRATKGSAQALLGKVYLQMTGFPLNETDKYALAEVKLKAVMDSGVYDLLDFYPDVFSLDHEQSNEMVFAVGFDGPGLNQGGTLGTFYGPNGQVQNGGQAGNNWFVNWELAGNSQDLPEGSGTWGERNNYKFAQGYQENDIRCRNNIAKHNVNWGPWQPEDGMYNPEARNTVAGWFRPNWKPWKWHNVRPSNWGTDTPYDYPYIRYADVLLMYSEALNGQDKLTQADIDLTVNRLRARARVFPTEVQPDTIAPDMVLSGNQDNADEILSERRKELCFEGWRRNDLIRFGRYQEAIKVTQPSWSNSGNPQTQYSDFEIRWPIPTSELQINPKLVPAVGY